MLLPALSAARERARAANCINRQKQVGVAEFMYGSVNKDHIAVYANTDYSQPNSVSIANGWGSADPSGKLVYGGCFGADAPVSAEDAELQAGNYFRCPSDSANFNLSGSPQTISYTFLIWSKAHSGWGSPAPEGRLIIGRDNPGSCIFFDMYPGTKNNHPNGNVNALYLGGHVKSLPLSAAQQAYVAWGTRVRSALDDITY
ncbi:hypothetical protein SDC9_190669 [bioreactor metagenome]|uniref:Uncharacterized protein n=1 Tax=bioreactor metagenome TaxID=1076179 RepID=A0A645HW70_9ZZZZ